MSRIQILPGLLVDKIAAGEVVERPASVVKELVENALDAGATDIRIEIRQGGKSLIRVSDNGFGMDKEDALLSLKRHATSKIKEEKDLFAIRSLGFRGEALPSIVSVSRLTLETKPKGGGVLAGTRIVAAGGEVEEAREAGCPEGTDISVVDLFYNTPARLKFLKSDAVEAGHIEEALIRLALGAPQTGFTYQVEEKIKWQAPKVEKPIHRLLQLLPADWQKDWMRLEEKNPLVSFQGWIAHPRLTQSQPGHIYFYLNGRFLKDRVLQHALQAGFEDYLMRGRYPVAVLFLEMDPAEVDVNVHPSKREVKFRSSNAVHDFVMRSVRKALQQQLYGDAPLSFDAAPRELFVPERIQHSVEKFYQKKSTPPPPHFQGASRPFVPEKSTPSEETLPVLQSGNFSSLKVLGQWARCYMVCESQEGSLILVDQHAAHERVGYEQLKASTAQREISSQRLLVPIPWEISSKKAALLEEYLPILRSAGFEMEMFSASTVMIQAVPALFSGEDVVSLLEAVAADLEAVGTSRSLEEKRDVVFKTMACHRQVRASDPLDIAEMEALLHLLDQYKVTHCPHGRPVAVILPVSAAEKWFKR